MVVLFLLTGAQCHASNNVIQCLRATLFPSLSPGSIQCLFDKSNNHYSWKKVTTTVHNIIVGKLWIDQVMLKCINIIGST